MAKRKKSEYRSHGNQEKKRIRQWFRNNKAAFLVGLLTGVIAGLIILGLTYGINWVIEASKPERLKDDAALRQWIASQIQEAEPGARVQNLSTYRADLHGLDKGSIVVRADLLIMHEYVEPGTDTRLVTSGPHDTKKVSASVIKVP